MSAILIWIRWLVDAFVLSSPWSVDSLRTRKGGFSESYLLVHSTALLNANFAHTHVFSVNRETYCRGLLCSRMNLTHKLTPFAPDGRYHTPSCRFSRLSFTRARTHVVLLSAHIIMTVFSTLPPDYCTLPVCQMTILDFTQWHFLLDFSFYSISIYNSLRCDRPLTRTSDTIDMFFEACISFSVALLLLPPWFVCPS